MTNVALLSFDTNTGKWRVTYNNRVIAASPNKHYAKRKATIEIGGIVEFTETAMIPAPSEIADEQFGINERFDFLSDFVRMVDDGTSASLLVTGEGGLGKTYTVNQALTEAGREPLHLESMELGTVDDNQYFTVVKGYSTPRGLYRSLYENRNRIMIFDDCDNILKDPVALNLLKGALDSYDKRIISWNAMSSGEDLPTSFEFKGGVIFISNLPLHKIDQSIRSRAIVVDLSMTTQQKIDRMEVLVTSDTFMPECSARIKRKALSFLEEMKDKARELNLRTLIKVTKVAARGGDWKRRAEYLLTSV